jgi:hypothetical protein
MDRAANDARPLDNRAPTRRYARLRALVGVAAVPFLKIIMSVGG